MAVVVLDNGHTLLTNVVITLVCPSPVSADDYRGVLISLGSSSSSVYFPYLPLLTLVILLLIATPGIAVKDCGDSDGRFHRRPCKENKKRNALLFFFLFYSIFLF